MIIFDTHTPLKLTQVRIISQFNLRVAFFLQEAKKTIIKNISSTEMRIHLWQLFGHIMEKILTKMSSLKTTYF